MIQTPATQAFSHNTLYVLRYSPLPSLLHSRKPKSRYNPFCHNTISASPGQTSHLSHNTISVLQHTYPLANQALSTCNTPHIAIQYPANLHSQSHYVTIQCLYCDTVPMLKWAVAHSVLAIFFFFSFFIFHLFFSYLFPTTGKCPKNIYTFFFSHFPEHQINL